MIKKFGFLLLVTSFFSVQLVGVAHAVEHHFEDHNHSSSFCKSCIDSKNFKFNLTNQNNSAEFSEIDFTQCTANKNSEIVSAIYFFNSRAPPIFS